MLFSMVILLVCCLGQFLGRYGFKKEASPGDLFRVSLPLRNCLGLLSGEVFRAVSGQIGFKIRASPVDLFRVSLPLESQQVLAGASRCLQSALM